MSTRPTRAVPRNKDIYFEIVYTLAFSKDGVDWGLAEHATYESAICAAKCGCDKYPYIQVFESIRSGTERNTKVAEVKPGKRWNI